MMIKEKGRRTRSDKKRDVKPTITIQLKEWYLQAVLYHKYAS
jgi:hypothetical protein